MGANETQVAGEHYKSDYQHWDFVVRGLGGRYFEGQVTKYVSRWRKKNGVQDLEKALHFLAKLKECYVNGDFLSLGAVWEVLNMDPAELAAEPVRFSAANNFSHSEMRVMEIISNWRTTFDLDSVKEHIEALILVERNRKETHGPE